MGVVLLTPIGLRPGGGVTYPTIVGGSATRDAAVADSSDSTYLQNVAAYPQSYSEYFDLQALSGVIPNNSIIQSVRLYLRSLRVAAGSQFAVETFAYSGLNQTGTETLVGTTATPNQATGSILDWYDTPYSGSGIVGAQSYSVVLYWQYLGTNNADKAYKLGLEITYNEPPVGTATGPTGTVVTARPSVTWTYSDADGDVQTAYQVRVFNATQYGAPLFDPFSSTAAWDSGKVFSAATSVVVGTDLPSGPAYRAYVYVWHADVLSTQMKSAGTYSAFTVSLVGPPTPTLTATADGPNARISLQIQGAVNRLTANQATLETDTVGWAAGTLTTIARSTAQFQQGAACLALTKITSTGSGLANTLTGLSAVPVVAGQSWAASAYFRAAATVRTCSLTINWYDSAGASTGSPTVGSGVANTTSGWTQATVAGTAPAGAAYAAIVVTVASMAVSEVQYVDAIALMPGASAATWSTGFGGMTETIMVERSADAGVTWATMRNFPATSPISQTLQVYDVEAAFGVTMQYRARMVETLGTTWVISPNSTVASDTIPASYAKWWLKDLVDTSMRLSLGLQPGLKISHPKPQVLDYPQGVSVAAVSHDGVKGAVITGSVWLLSQADYNTFYALINTGRTLLLQDVMSRQWYVQTGDVTDESILRSKPRAGETTILAWTFSVDVVFNEVSSDI